MPFVCVCWMIMVRLRPVILQNETKLYLGLMACSHHRGGVYLKQVDTQSLHKPRAGFISPVFRKLKVCAYKLAMYSGCFSHQWRRAGLFKGSAFPS